MEWQIHSIQFGMPLPSFDDISSTGAVLAMSCMYFFADAGLKSSRIGSRSLLLINTRSAVRNMTGYLAGLSSPSGTDNRVTLRCWPRSKLAGQTRLPTFSIKTTSNSDRSRLCNAWWIMCASRWQALPVAIWIALTPCLQYLAPLSRNMQIKY